MCSGFVGLPIMSRMKTATEVLEQFFAAINRNDMTAVTEDFDAQIVRIEPEGFPTAGRSPVTVGFRQLERKQNSIPSIGSCLFEQRR